MDDFEAVILTAALLESGLDLGLVADQIQLSDSRIGLKRQPDPIDDDSASVVATHDIDYDSHISKRRGSPPRLPADHAKSAQAPCPDAP